MHLLHQPLQGRRQPELFQNRRAELHDQASRIGQRLIYDLLGLGHSLGHRRRQNLLLGLG